MTEVAAREFDPERPVVEAVQQGDPFAFREWVERHHHWVRGAVIGVLGDSDRVDDVVQQVWTTAWQRIDSLRDVATWRSWLYRIARNAALDAGREESRRRDRKTREAVRSATKAVMVQPSMQLSGQDNGQAIRSAIQALPALYREPFVLRHINDWSYAQIAEVLEMPVDTVETRLVRARRLLREALKDAQAETASD